MKIGMVTTQFAEVGGVENVVRSLTEQLKQKNHEVHLITRERENNTEEFTESFEDVHIIEGTESYKDFLIKGRKFLKNNQDKFDVLHFHNWSPILPAIGLDTPTVLTFHGTTFDVKMSDKDYLQAGLYWILEEISLNIPDQATSITRSHLKPFYTFKAVQIIRNGVDTEKYRPAENQEELREKWDVEGKGILMVGKHIPAKNHSALIDAASQLDQEITLMVPSDGPLQEDLKQQAEREDVDAEFYGRVSDQELVELYQAADLFCLPSKNEGLPLSMLEALSTGLPVLVSNVGDNQNIVEEANAGYTFQNKDSLNAKLEEALDSDLKEKRGNARRYAEHNLDWNQITDKYVQLYNELV